MGSREISIPENAEGFWKGARLRAARHGTQIIDEIPTEIKDMDLRMSGLDLARRTPSNSSLGRVIQVEVGSSIFYPDFVNECEIALGIAQNTLLRDQTPVRREDLDTEKDTEETGKGLPYIGERILERPNRPPKKATKPIQIYQLEEIEEAQKKRSAENKLSWLFMELGYTEIGLENSEGIAISPFTIITDLRDKNPNTEVTREKTLIDLLVSRNIPMDRAIGIGVLWGEAYGSSDVTESLERIADEAGFSPAERDVYYQTLLGSLKGHVRLARNLK